MPTKIAVLFNCQGEVIARALQDLLPRAEVIYVAIANLAQNEQQRSEAMALLATCNHILMMDASAGHKYISLAWMQATGAAVHRLPTMRFRGFHPDTVMIVPKSGRKIGGPTTGYHSRIAIAGFLSDLSEVETLDLYNALVFARLGYFDEYARQFELMRLNFEDCGLDFRPIGEKLAASGCFMHSINHPKVAALLELAIGTCKLLALPIENANVRPEDLPDLLAPAATHPVFPEIAARIGIAAEGTFRPNVPQGGTWKEFSHAQFIARSFKVFATTDRETLIATEGVRQAIASLDLGGPKPRREAQPDQHGRRRWATS
jgi:hypothetical protein